MSAIPHNSALSTQHSALAAPPPPRGVQWITLEEAARRSGKSTGHLARLCGQAWLAQGLARQQRPDAGGKPRWFIREDADAALARVQFPDQLSDAFDLRTLCEDHRRQLLERKRLLDDWLRARKDAAALDHHEEQITEHFLDHLERERGIKLSRRTLHNWHTAFRKSGLAGLVDQRWLKGRDEKQDDPFLEELKRHYLSLRRLSKQVCYEIANTLAAERGWSVPSYRTACRCLDQIPKPIVLKYRFGEEAYVNDAEPYIERDYSHLASNELWVSDHHEFDVFVNCGTPEKPLYKRPWLTAWMDMRSRKIVGHHVFSHDPNTQTILTALEQGVTSHGVPVGAYHDNGKDYDSYALTGQTKAMRRRKVHVEIDGQRVGGVYTALGISSIHALPYHGQSKPIERFFRTVEDRFGKRFATYFGNKPDNRPEDFQQHLDAGHAPGFAEFVQEFERWLADDYHVGNHSGNGMDGCSPSKVWEAQLITKRTARPELLEVLLQERTPPVDVTQNGVTCKGLRYGQYEPALRQYIGQQVCLRINRHDLSKVTVWTLDDKPICVAPANSQVPANATDEDLRQAKRMKATARRNDLAARQTRMHLAEDLPDLMTRAAAHRRRQEAASDPGPGDPPPPSIQPVRSDLEDHLPAIRRALEKQELRPAVGAESVSINDLAGRVRKRGQDDAGMDAADSFRLMARRFRSGNEDDE